MHYCWINFTDVDRWRVWNFVEYTTEEVEQGQFFEIEWWASFSFSITYSSGFYTRGLNQWCSNLLSFMPTILDDPSIISTAYRDINAAVLNLEYYSPSSISHTARIETKKKCRNSAKHNTT